MGPFARVGRVGGSCAALNEDCRGRKREKQQRHKKIQTLVQDGRRKPEWLLTDGLGNKKSSNQVYKYVRLVIFAPQKVHRCWWVVQAGTGSGSYRGCSLVWMPPAVPQTGWRARLRWNLGGTDTPSPSFPTVLACLCHARMGFGDSWMATRFKSKIPCKTR